MFNLSSLEMDQFNAQGKWVLVMAGDFGDGMGLVTALTMCAEGIYMGTRFAATQESPLLEHAATWKMMRTGLRACPDILLPVQQLSLNQLNPKIMLYRGTTSGLLGCGRKEIRQRENSCRMSLEKFLKLPRHLGTLLAGIDS
jgi:hypothetical protein